MRYHNLISSFDKKLVDEVAELWISRGGDSEGIYWMVDAIRDRIAELEQEKTEKSIDESRKFC